MVRGEMIKNHPITIPDIQNAITIFGPGIGSLHGKTVRHTPEIMVSDYITIPPEFLDQNYNLEITTDLMFVNKTPFLVTLGQRVKFTTIKSLPNRRAPTLLKRIWSVLSLYNKQ